MSGDLPFRVMLYSRKKRLFCKTVASTDAPSPVAQSRPVKRDV